MLPHRMATRQKSASLHILNNQPRSSKLGASPQINLGGCTGAPIIIRHTIDVGYYRTELECVRVQGHRIHNLKESVLHADVVGVLCAESSVCRSDTAQKADKPREGGPMASRNTVCSAVQTTCSYVSMHTFLDPGHTDKSTTREQHRVLNLCT
jgi:hypothetical protein